MIVAIASGKGGTGKTTISTALALSNKENTLLLDLDVEEPNANLFLKGKYQDTQKVYSLIPEINSDKCMLCNECVKICNFNAIASTGKEIMVFKELCHSCKGCKLVCDFDAISMIDNYIGDIISYQYDKISLKQGKLKINHPMAPPLIKEVKKYINNNITTIIDCPPGTSCPMITAVEGVDYVILVTEPTLFGLNDLSLAVQTIRLLNIPFGVVINKDDNKNDNLIKNYCLKEKIDIFLTIEENDEIAKAYSIGENLINTVPELADSFNNLILKIKKITGEQ